MMSMLTDSSPLPTLCRKRPFEHEGRQNDHQDVRHEVMEARTLFKHIYKKLFEECDAAMSRKNNGQIYVSAAMLLKKQQKWLNGSDKVVGDVPGIEVVDQFEFRTELTIVGLHRQYTSGIDYMMKDGKPIATSIVDSGRYSNGTSSSNVLIYSGQGGNPNTADSEPKDQKLERGNLALKNSMNDGHPAVRVIRSQQARNGSKSTKTYVYDGLYMVNRYWEEKSRYGRLVFKFELNKISGQPPRRTLEIVSMPEKYVRHSRCVVEDDISQGKEKIPIRVMNAIDNEKPRPFNYMANMVYPDSYELPVPSGCNCTDGCSDTGQCSCVIKNGGVFAFNNDKAIVKQRRITVYECGPYRKCPPLCKNRVSQLGVKHQLEVFKTESRGWGVRSPNTISKGSFICEYVGELLSEEEAEERADCGEYLFDIGEKEEDGFVVDAMQCGNIGRFINHSCLPNVYSQYVLYDHEDKKLPHIMLFATKKIHPLQELIYNYKYEIDKVRDANGNIKRKDCHCGARRCSGRMY